MEAKMKKLIYLFIILAMLLVAIPVYAQGTTDSKAPGSWKSSIAIHNPSGGDAMVELTFYDSSGSPSPYKPEVVVQAGRTVYLYNPEDFGTLAGGQYSMVASSNQPVNIVASQRSTGPRTAGSYTGFTSDEASYDLYFPGLYKGYYTFNSELVIQNTGSASANITISFYRQSTGEPAGPPVVANVPVGASRVFAMQDLPSVPSGKLSGLISAHVNSSQPIVGVGGIWSPRVKGLFSIYNAYKEGTTSVLYVPALYNNYYNFVSALTVQNIHETLSAPIRVTYSNGRVRNATLAPNQSIEYFQPNDTQLPRGNRAGVFSAKVESLEGVPIVAFVSVEDTSKGLLASYNGAIEPTTVVNCGLVYQNYFRWFSAQTVQNVGTDPTNVTISYSVGTPGQYDRTFNNIPPNGTINIIELPQAGSKLPSGTAASAVITSSGQPIIAVTQLNNEFIYSSAPGDYLEAYTCTPVD
jgi:hypothetical protein